MTEEKLKDFFKERPGLSRKMLAKEAGIAYSLLNFILSGERSLTDDKINKLLPVLKKYGYDKAE